MRTVLSYLLLLTLALSGFSGSVQQAHAMTLTDTIVQQQAHIVTLADTIAQHPATVLVSEQQSTPCHSSQQQSTDDSEHRCCEQAQHICKGDCCAQHCAAAGALLATELFCYMRPDNTVARLQTRLPRWLFTEDPPPPINA